MDPKMFKNDPRWYALELVNDRLINADYLLLCALSFMSHNDVRDMLDANKLSPQFEVNDDE